MALALLGRHRLQVAADRVHPVLAHLGQRLARGLTLTDQGRDYLPELSAGFDLLGESTARVRAKRADGVLTLRPLEGVILHEQVMELPQAAE